MINECKIKAHCAIIACRSNYLRQRIRNAIYSTTNTSSSVSSSHIHSGIKETNDDESNSETIAIKPLFDNENKIIDVKLNDINNANAFKIVVEFIYTDRIISIEGKGMLNHL